ncbi:hypothetical protein HDV05_003196, partial [Chytridiales sp. JEL 0842]
MSLQKSTLGPYLKQVLLMGSLPVLVEALFLSMLVRRVFALDGAWSFTLAFGVASVSPGVVIPLLLNLYERPQWRASRLPPILLGATGLDVLIATTGFGVSLASVFGHVHEKRQKEGGGVVDAGGHGGASGGGWIARGFEEVLGGLMGGCLVGVLAFLLKRMRVVEPIRTTVVFCVSTMGMMTAKWNGFPGTASSSVIIGWAIVGNIWDKEVVEASTKRLKLVWKYAEPLLFPLIGASVSLTEIPAAILLTSCLCIILSICVKMGAAYMTGKLAGLTPDERLFACGTWTGKGSVQ